MIMLRVAELGQRLRAKCSVCRMPPRPVWWMLAMGFSLRSTFSSSKKGLYYRTDSWNSWNPYIKLLCIVGKLYYKG